MGVDHRGAYIAVAQHLLDLADVIVGLQEMRSERVPQGVRRHPLGNARLAGRCLDRPLHIGFMPMVTPQFARGLHERQPSCGKAPLPDEVPRRRLRLFLEGSRQKHAVVAPLQVLLMECPDRFELPHDVALDLFRQRHGPRFAPLAKLDRKHPCVKMEMVEPQIGCLGQPQATPLHEHRQ